MIQYCIPAVVPTDPPVPAGYAVEVKTIDTCTGAVTIEIRYVDTAGADLGTTKPVAWETCECCGSGGGSSAPFTITDGVTSQSVADGDTVTFASGNPNLTVVVSATDTVTVDYDLCADIAGLPAGAPVTNGMQLLGADCQVHDITFPGSNFNISDGGNTEVVTPGETILFTSTNPNLGVLVSGPDTVTLTYDLCSDLGDLPVGTPETFVGLDGVGACVVGPLAEITLVGTDLSAIGTIDQLVSLGETITFDGGSCLNVRTSDVNTVNISPILADDNTGTSNSTVASACITNGIECGNSGLWVDPNPVHVFAECEMPAQAFDNTTICPAIPAVSPFSMVHIANGSIGTNIGGAAIASNSITLAVPAQPADSVLVFNVTYVQSAFAGGAGGNANTEMGRYNVSTPANSGPLSLQAREDYWQFISNTDTTVTTPPGIPAGGDTMRHELLWLRNPAAGNYTFTWPDAVVGTTFGMAAVQVYRLQGVDLDAPFKQIASAKTHIHDNAGTTIAVPYESDQASVSLVNPNCSSVYFMAGRHVTGQTTNAGPGMATTPGTVTTLNEFVVNDVLSNCQIGLEGGPFTGSGFTWSSWANWSRMPTNGVNGHTNVFALEVNCSNVAASSAARSSVCTLDATNPCCNPDGRAELTVSGAGDGIYISAGAGNHFQVIMEINGTEYVAAEIDNSAGCHALAMTFPPFNYKSDLVVGSCDSIPSQTVRTRTRCMTYSSDPANAITIGAWRADVRLDHI